MKTVAIICEYNPFHTGHLYQIKKIREEFGTDTKIIAIMSGNFTQRGDFAIADKTARAKCAVDCGVNLVLELPFPFSMGSAEFFAKSSIKIVKEIKVVDFISFGSESGQLDELTEIADLMLSRKYEIAISDIEKNDKDLGYAKKLQLAIEKISDINFDFTPNNILAIEYLKAIKTEKLNIGVHTLKRFGADYNEECTTNLQHQSATSIRNEIFNNSDSALLYIPELAKLTLQEEKQKGCFPCDSNKLSTSVISHFRLNSPKDNLDIQDANGGLYNRIRDKSFDTDNLNSLIRSSQTKKFTNARIRRAIWFSYFGITSSEMKKLPAYSQVLAFDKIGRTILKDIKKQSEFPILTKPSAIEKLDDLGKAQKNKSDIADSIFDLSKPHPFDSRLSLKFTPYVKKDD